MPLGIYAHAPSGEEAGPIKSVRLSRSILQGTVITRGLVDAIARVTKYRDELEEAFAGVLP